MTWDPLNTAMDLFGELQELARREREVDEAYLQMAERCETLALELLQVKSKFLSFFTRRLRGKSRPKLQLLAISLLRMPVTEYKKIDYSIYFRVYYDVSCQC